MNNLRPLIFQEEWADIVSIVKKECETNAVYYFAESDCKIVMKKIDANEGTCVLANNVNFTRMKIKRYKNVVLCLIAFMTGAKIILYNNEAWAAAIMNFNQE